MISSIYEQVGLLFLALRIAVPDDDVLVVRQHHALHEVVTKFRPVRIRKGGAFLYRGADLETDRKSTRLNSSHSGESRMPAAA